MSEINYAETTKELKELKEFKQEQIMSSYDEFTKFLKDNAKLKNLSVSNTVLATAQNPDCQLVKTYNDWKRDKLSLKSGEYDNPLYVYKAVKKEGFMNDENKFVEYKNASLSERNQMNRGEIKKVTIFDYRVERAYDISQTICNQNSYRKYIGKNYKNYQDEIGNALNKYYNTKNKDVTELLESAVHEMSFDKGSVPDIKKSEIFVNFIANELIQNNYEVKQELSDKDKEVREKFFESVKKEIKDISVNEVKANAEDVSKITEQDVTLQMNKNFMSFLNEGNRVYTKVRNELDKQINPEIQKTVEKKREAYKEKKAEMEKSKEKSKDNRMLNQKAKQTKSKKR